MAAFPATLVLFLYITLASGYTLLQEDENEIIWPSKYHFKGEKLNFKSSLKETFEIWYDAELNRSRIDFYDGAIQKWYDGDNGASYVRHPVTTEEVTNEVLCVWRFSKDEKIDFLPDVSEFTYTGQTMTLYDKVVDVWSSTDQFEDKLVRETTLYVFKTDSGVDLPVQQVTKAFNFELGGLDSHVIMNYFDYSDSFSQDALTLENNYDCDWSPFGENFHKDIKFLHPDLPMELDQAFELYINHHGKQYHEKEHQKRKRIF